MNLARDILQALDEKNVKLVLDMMRRIVSGKTNESQWIIEALQENPPSASVWA